MPPNQLVVLPSAPDISESYSATDEEIGLAISRAQENVLRQQKPDGHWRGELIVDSTLCSDYIVFMHWCGEVDAQLQRRCVRHILKRQLPDGGWNIYHGGPGEFQGKIRFDRRVNLARAAMINVPAAIRQLAFENVANAATLQLSIHFSAPVHEKDVIRAEGAIDNQIAAPMAVGFLLAQQVLLCARDRPRDLFVRRRVRLGYFRGRAWQYYQLPRGIRHVRLTRLVQLVLPACR